MEGSNVKVKNEAKVPVKVSLVESLLIFMACLATALGAIYFILN